MVPAIIAVQYNTSASVTKFNVRFPSHLTGIFCRFETSQKILHNHTRHYPENFIDSINVHIFRNAIEQKHQRVVDGLLSGCLVLKLSSRLSERAVTGGQVQ
jgi:hypothetical protein